MTSLFLLNQALKLLVIGLLAYACGQLVAHADVKVNYTRKIMHFSLFFIPIYLDRAFVYDKSLGLFVISSFIFLAVLFFFVKPVRLRVGVIQTMFYSFDRPEDRPFTLLWLSTQVLAGYLVIVPMIVLFSKYGLENLILIPILITAIGDGLAEPVGVRFGKYKYRVKALFTSKTYFRTIEGSACVFITSLVILGIYHASFTLPQLVAALVIMPVVMTIVEAVSPHTWDSPTLFLAGYLVLFGISAI